MDELSQIRNSFPLSEPSYIVLLIIAIFSFLMLTLIAVIAYMSKNTPKFRLLIMFNLLIINFMNSFSYILNFSFKYENKYYPYYDNDSLCISQGFLLITCSTSRDFWILILTFSTYKIVNNNEDFDTINRKYLICFCLLGYLVPLLISCTFYFKNVFGVCDLNCWIKKEVVGQITYGGYSKFISYLKLSVMICVICLMIILIRNLLQVNKNDKSYNKEIMHLAWKLMLFPTIQFFAWCLPTIYSTLFTISPSASRYFGLASLFVGSIQGVLYPLCFLVTSKPFSLCCKKKTPEPQNELAIIDGNIE